MFTQAQSTCVHFVPRTSNYTGQIQQIVLAVHRRNGGSLEALDPNWPLLAPQLMIDSLDLAEIMIAIERTTGLTPFDAPVPPKTWGDILRTTCQPEAAL